MGKRGFVSANGEDSEAYGIRGMAARVGALEIRDEAMDEIRRLAALLDETTPIFDALAVGTHIVVMHQRVMIISDLR